MLPDDVEGQPSDPAETVNDVVDEAAAPAPAPDPAPTEPSGDEPTDMLSAVRAVLQPKTADPSPAAGTSAGAPDARSGDTPTGEATGTPTTTPTTTDPPPDLTEADFADVEKPSIKKRIETLLAQRGAVRAENEALREPAVNWSRHVEFLSQNGITPQQAQDLYGVGAMLARGDFVNFLAAVEPYVHAARAAVGAVLPQDLQRRVDEGALSQEDADELSRTRAAAAHAQRIVQQSEVQRTADANAARATSVREAMTQWEAGVSARDPDYARKRDMVTITANAMVHQRGQPPDPGTAVAWANEALAEVNRFFSSARPPAQPTPARPSSVAPATKARPEPRNLREAVEMAMQNMRA